MVYRNNPKAWMLITLFQEWLKDFDYQIAQKHGGQRVLLLLDNCTSHKLGNLVLPHVDVYFLLPNTISKTQPIHAGIIIKLMMSLMMSLMTNCLMNFLRQLKLLIYQMQCK